MRAVTRSSTRQSPSILLRLSSPSSGPEMTLDAVSAVTVIRPGFPMELIVGGEAGL